MYVAYIVRLLAKLLDYKKFIFVFAYIFQEYTLSSYIKVIELKTMSHEQKQHARV